jgi:hypothetical protein
MIFISSEKKLSSFAFVACNCDNLQNCLTASLRLNARIVAQVLNEKKATKLKQLNLKMQEHLVTLCPDITSLADCSLHYAVHQNRVYYECISLLEAIDVCLKVSFVFNLHYSL